MQYFLRLIILSFTIFGFFFSPSALAGSSSAVTSAGSAFNNQDLSGQDFSGKKASEYEFVYTKLNATDFSNAQLQGAVFNNCDLTNANFSGVDFSNGIAYLSRFIGTDLRDAVLTEAMLLRSTFDKAQIEGADFSLAVLDRDQVKKLCAIASGVNSKTGVATRDSLGCPSVQ